MWPFKRKNNSSPSTGPQCTHCNSCHTKVITHHGAGEPGYVKTWRGQRYVTCRCFDCGQDFYADAPQDATIEALGNDDLVDDAEALRSAEDELKKELDDEDDRTCW